jgi:hypothetical protein
MGGPEGFQGYLTGGIAGDYQEIGHQKGAQTLGPVQEDIFHHPHRLGSVGEARIVGYIMEPRTGNAAAGLSEIGQSPDSGIQEHKDFFGGVLFHDLKRASKTALADSDEGWDTPPFPALLEKSKSMENHSQKFALPLSVTGYSTVSEQS